MSVKELITLLKEVDENMTVLVTPFVVDLQEGIEIREHYVLIK